MTILHFYRAVVVASVLVSSTLSFGFTFQSSLVHTQNNQHCHYHSYKRVFHLNSSKRDAVEEESSTSGKGFGKNMAPKTKSIKTTSDDTPTSVSSTTFTPDVVPSSSSSTSSAGKEALAKLRQADMQRRQEELKSMQQLQEIDQSLKEDPSLAVIPEKVAVRMGKRMLPFVGLPLFGSMITFVLFWYLATYKDLAIPTVLVAYATIGILVIGLLGITYSVMSASWDEDREGSFMGWEEFQKNVNNVRDGLQRSRENAILRDKLSTLSDEEKKKLGSDQL